MEKSYLLRKQVLGESDPHTLSSLAGLARVYVDQRRLDRAKPLFDRLVEASRDRRFGQMPFPLIGCRSLASAYMGQGEFALAGELYRIAVEKTPPEHGALHLRRDRLLAGLGESLLRQGRDADAEPPLRECLERRKERAPAARCRFEAMSLLGRSLAGQGKLEEAGPLLREGLEGMKRLEDEVPAEDPDPDDRRLSLEEAAEWLARLHDGKNDR